MKGCLTTFAILIILGAFFKVAEKYPVIFVFVLLAAVLLFIIIAAKNNDDEERRKQRRELAAEIYAREKEEFDRGYFHGFQDGLRDAKGITHRSLYEANSSQRYYDAYKKGYHWGYNFDEKSEATDPDYPY